MRLFVSEEKRSARREKRAPVSFTVENFTKWAAENLHSQICVAPLDSHLRCLHCSQSCYYIMEVPTCNTVVDSRNNNVSVAEGAMYLLKPLAWSGKLPLQAVHSAQWNSRGGSGQYYKILLFLCLVVTVDPLKMTIEEYDLILFQGS